MPPGVEGTESIVDFSIGLIAAVVGLKVEASAKSCRSICRSAYPPLNLDVFYRGGKVRHVDPKDAVRLCIVEWNAVDGGIDPSGLVKGWAADAAADILTSAGVGHVQVNAAGDLSLRGGFVDSDGVVKPWPIGVVNPNNKLEVVKVYEILDGAIATSGTYERGAHIVDPHSGMIAIGAKSATVVGAAGWLCDAMATAVMVGGTDSAQWFGQSELAGYQLFGVNRHEDTAWEI